jgi:hypothetical protein
MSPISTARQRSGHCGSPSPYRGSDSASLTTSWTRQQQQKQQPAVPAAKLPAAVRQASAESHACRESLRGLHGCSRGRAHSELDSVLHEPLQQQQQQRAEQHHQHMHGIMPGLGHDPDQTLSYSWRSTGGTSVKVSESASQGTPSAQAASSQ